MNDLTDDEKEQIRQLLDRKICMSCKSAVEVVTGRCYDRMADMSLLEGAHSSF